MGVRSWKVPVMLSVAKHLYLSSNSIDRITYSFFDFSGAKVNKSGKVKIVVVTAPQP